MPKILTLVDYYLPGYKAGGPVRSIANMVDQLSHEYRFKIVTKDRDLGSNEPYLGIVVDEWQELGQSDVYYSSPKGRSLTTLRHILNATDYDILYLNSFFSTFSVKALVLRKLGLLPRTPVVIAPRGEFSLGALALKERKKRSYLRLAKTSGLYHGVTWHVSSSHEAADIRHRLGDQIQDVVAPNLPPMLSASLKRRKIKESGRLKVVFLSRVDRMKNLDGAIKMLASVQGEVLFDIYGPVSDSAYWQECQTLLRALPPNVTVRYQGPVGHEKVSETLVNYDLFFLPTHGENYGHAILEALVAGCPVLISDRTPWRNLEEKGVGWELPLERPESFTRVLQQCVEMDTEAHSRLSAQAREFGVNRSRAPEVVEQNLALFARALEI